ncbi:Hsp70 family protein [Actinokineospora enzanensis]|uniref:Hsp70 family protein n=1 Tax=Actinokineospora enzanensis TaxID=155975 RepID=UPI0003804EC8|nr:Hsp70 family protein [Actinokineospora enzanensis]
MSDSDSELRVFGIDLGTTYSAIAYVDETGRPSVCRNTDGLETTPSVVYFENESNVVVGSVAKNTAVTQPDRVVSLIKREMGTQATYRFDDVDHGPESISALILKQLAQDAGAHTDGPVRQVVITVPAYFGMLERDATKNAGRIAGLDVLAIVPEPVAAALHYEATTQPGERTILVYDLGGGTFDTSVIRVSETEISVVCTDGDDRLGGADWDARLRDHLLERFAEHVPAGVDVEDDEEFLQALVTTAEETKKQLSRAEARPVALRGAGASARVEVTREKFEELTRDLLDKTVDIVQRTLATLVAKEPGTTIDDVLLVGGSSSMPAVARRLREEFGWEPRLHDPHLAVAKGAALFALSRVVLREVDQARAEAADDVAGDAAAAEALETVAARTGIATSTLAGLSGKQTHNVLPKAFGVRLVDTDDPDWRSKPTRHYVKHLVHANDRLPTGERTMTAGTVVDDQTEIELALYEQSGVVAGPEMAENKPLADGAAAITGLRPAPAGAPVDIRMEVDDEGLLRLRATERATGQQLEIQVRVSVLDAAQVAAATRVVSGLAVTG